MDEGWWSDRVLERLGGGQASLQWYNVDKEKESRSVELNCATAVCLYKIIPDDKMEATEAKRKGKGKGKGKSTTCACSMTKEKRKIVQIGFGELHVV